MQTLGFKAELLGSTGRERIGVATAAKTVPQGAYSRPFAFICGSVYTPTGSAALIFAIHSRCAMGEISDGLISLRPPQKTFV